MEKGLPVFEAKQRLAKFGKNEIVETRSQSALYHFFSQFRSFINLILFIAALFSFFIGNTVDFVFIILVLLLNAIVGFIQEYRAEQSIKKLKEYIKATVRVVRDSQEMEIPSEELVPGDIVKLYEGIRIPADGVLLKSTGLEVDESILTGESVALEKMEKSQIFLGTLVTRGNGIFHVEATGMLTRFGKIASTLSDLEADKTPLQKKLDTLGKLLSLLVLGISLLLLPLGILRHEPLFPIILLTISVIVAAIPQGLPVVVTIALAIGTNRMALKKAIARKMPAIETLGAVQVILTDKTGTLTQNLMTVKTYHLFSKDEFPLLLRACTVGNTASFIQHADGVSFEVVGDKTDAALLEFVQENLRQEQNNIKSLEEFKKEGTIIEEFPFDPETKTISSIWEDENTTHILVRGAPEMILEHCLISEEEKQKILKMIQEYATAGLRVIGFATKTHKKGDSLKRNLIEETLTFLGVTALYDPPRKEAKASVKEARRAGIRPIMVTGDNELTALAIAQEVGLVEDNEDVLTGTDIEKLTDEELEKVVIKTSVFARTSPEDKLRLVETFKRLGYVVGVTGDGVNDSLALKRADVGIAMGGKGTDVAKEAADIILTDDNFSTLVKAVEEGRTIYNNILKAITYLLAGNTSELMLIMLAAVFGLPTPLLPTQLLWINLVTDGLPAMALASDTKDPEILTHKPRNPASPLLSYKRVLFIVCGGVYLAVMFLITFKLLLNTHSEAFARTVVFNMLVCSHMLLAFVVRGQTWLRANPLLIGTVVVTIALQIIITFVPFFQPFFHIGF